ncbi:MAG: aldehyde dehydrogenase (NADP(+)) [Pseudomonadota bacterium]
MLSGKHLIAGEWVEGPSTFTAAPVAGDPHPVFTGTPDLVNRAAAAAEAAFPAFAASSRDARANLLDAIADAIEARGEDLTRKGTAETGLPEARLQGERGRTTGQLRLFAAHIRDGAYLDRRHDPALPDRAPLPRPDLRVIQRPVGPVAVFGASNFPLAFSTAGGDTAAALAAGCPVVVKGHEAHPGTSEIVAGAIAEAIAALGFPPGIFSHVNGGDFSVGQTLVQHPAIKAVGFTGSLRGGRALFDLCAVRPEPIPFFGELGSVNPIFLLPGALGARGEDIAKGWAGSLTMGAGQFCTNPGIAIAQAGDAAEAFISSAAAALSEMPVQVMLTDGICDAFGLGRDRVANSPGVEETLRSNSGDRKVGPHLYRTTADAFLTDQSLAHEVFGPLGLVVLAKSAGQMIEIAEAMEGQLTATLHLDDNDVETARMLLPALERKAGRVLANGFPTGVEVADAMVHGGPYPASTNFGATSVGTLSIRRFLRPVCYQNLPEALLPDDLRNAALGA